jgi:signal peptidase I
MADEESHSGSHLADGTLPGEGASEHLADSDGSAPDDAGLGETSGARVARTQLSTAADPQVLGDEAEPSRPESGADTGDGAQSVASDTGDGAQPAQTESGDGGKPPRHGVLRRFAPRGPKKPHKKAPWWELPVLIAVAIAVAVLIKTFLVQPFYIPSESMEKTLHGCPGCSGDRVLVNKLIFDLRDPHPGDIVVFRAPSDWDEEPAPRAPSNPLVKGVRWFGQLVGFVPPDERDLIKRVIAVGGQTVQCCDSKGRVQISDHGVNGPWRSLDEPYIFENSAWDSRSKPAHLASGGSDQRTFGPITIPKGRLWVMGDHRGDSADSRFHCIEAAPADHVCGTSDTTVAVSKVIGKGVLIAWPPSRWRTLGTPGTFKHSAEAALPLLGGAAFVLPLFGLRRRRRRR